MKIKHTKYGNGEILAFEPFANIWAKFETGSNGRKRTFTVMFADTKENLSQIFINGKNLNELIDQNALRCRYIKICKASSRSN